MRTVTLTFPGRFEDAFLYMGRLITITENRSIRVYDMENIIEKIQEDEALLDAPKLLFLRNDMIDHERFRHKPNNLTGKADFLRAIDQIESQSINIGTDFVNTFEWDLEIDADILLDLNIYNGRLYIGTNLGLYHLDLDWESEITAPIHEVQKRLDTKCIHTTGKFGTVNASCGSEGWFSFLDDFNLGMNNTRREKHIEEYSLRTGWLDFDIVNYPTTVEPTLFSSVRTTPTQELIESKNSFEQENWIVIGLEENQFNLSELFVNSNRGNSFDLENLQFVYNSSQALFASTYDGDLFALGLDKRSSSTPTISYVSRFEGLGSLVSSIHTLNVGMDQG
jgi:hypothetical protein